MKIRLGLGFLFGISVLAGGCGNIPEALLDSARESAKDAIQEEMEEVFDEMSDEILDFDLLEADILEVDDE